MYLASAQGVDERMINVRYCYCYYYCYYYTMSTKTVVEYNRTSFLSFYLALKDDCPVCCVVCPSLSVSALPSLRFCLFTVFRVFCSSLSSACSSESSSLSFYLHS